MILKRGQFFSVLVTAIVGAIFLLLAYETWALLTDHKPISDYFREAVHAFPGWAFAAAIVIGIIVGHFLWGSVSGLLAPPPRRLSELRRPRA